MADSNRIRVAVIFGGRSGEHEVSLRSAKSIIHALDKTKYEILPVGITREGRWIAGNEAMLTAGISAEQSTQIALIGEPGTPTLKAIEPVPGEAFNSLRDIASVDVVFPVLHGPYGEDGTIQGLLELSDIAYVGAGVVGSAVGMDKAIFKAVMASHGIPILPYRLVLRIDWDNDRDAVIADLEAHLSYPMFVKPANLGSSVGVHKAKDRTGLASALDDAALYDRRLVVEQGIDAREIEVSVLGNEDPAASVPGEIIPGDEFYSYDDKYINDTAQLLIPADLDDGMVRQVQEVAIHAFRVIDCAGLARVDFLLDRHTGELWMNEVNTIPGFTSISMYPKLWEASGVSYSELVDRLVQLALKRHADKQRNKTSYESGT